MNFSSTFPKPGNRFASVPTREKKILVRHGRFQVPRCLHDCPNTIIAWHIDIRTSHLWLLTTNHRSYSQGEHPHVCWVPDSKSVESTSNKRGNADVVIAFLPLDKWTDPFAW